MGAPAYQVTNLETCSPRQVALLVLGFFGLWATLYGLGASAPPLYVSQCSSSTRCADGVDGANLFSTGATPLYVSDPALCANKSACTRETCYLDRDGTLDWGCKKPPTLDGAPCSTTKTPCARRHLAWRNVVQLELVAVYRGKRIELVALALGAIGHRAV